MRRHLRVCQRCAHHDTRIRRSLLIVHNLPPIEPSPEFMARLNARLKETTPFSATDDIVPRPYFPSLGAFAALAAGIAAIGYVALDTTRFFSPNEPVRLAPVVATTPETTPATMASPAFVASVPTGMPLWPAVLMVGQAPLQFASMEFRETR